MNEKILLSLCIPTYNRAETLRQTLDALFANPDLDPEKVEVVVSDNASTDNTAEVVGRYPRVRYFRNETNIGANANFTMGLSRCRGRYLRLMNDTVRFNEGMLARMLREIEAADPAKENLYFLQNKKHKERVIQGKNELLGVVSFYITWIGNFGMWRTDFEKIENKDRFVDTMLHQVDLTLRMAENGKRTKVYEDAFVQVEEVKNKGNYDFFHIFITNYLSILKFHRIGGFSMKREKFRLFCYFILPFMKRDNQYHIDTGNRAIMIKRYWYEPYYLPATFLYGTLKALKREY